MIACLIVPCTMAFLRVVRSAPQSDTCTRCREQQQSESRWLRYNGTRRLSVRAAASGLVELGTPGVVVGLCVRVSQALAPDDVVTPIDSAIIIEVAGQRGTHDLKYQGAGDLAQGRSSDCYRPAGRRMERAGHRSDSASKERESLADGGYVAREKRDVERATERDIAVVGEHDVIAGRISQLEIEQRFRHSS